MFAGRMAQLSSTHGHWALDDLWFGWFGIGHFVKHISSLFAFRSMVPVSFPPLFPHGFNLLPVTWHKGRVSIVHGNKKSLPMKTRTRFYICYCILQFIPSFLVKYDRSYILKQGSAKLSSPTDHICWTIIRLLWSCVTITAQDIELISQYPDVLGSPRLVQGNAWNPICFLAALGRFFSWVLDRALSLLDAGYWFPFGEVKVERIATV